MIALTLSEVRNWAVEGMPMQLTMKTTNIYKIEHSGVGLSVSGLPEPCQSLELQRSKSMDKEFNAIGEHGGYLASP